MNKEFDPQKLIKTLNRQSKIKLLNCLLKDVILREKRIKPIDDEDTLASLKTILANLNAILPKNERPKISDAAAFFNRTYSGIVNRLPHHKLGLIYGSYIATLMGEIKVVQKAKVARLKAKS